MRVPLQPQTQSVFLYETSYERDVIVAGATVLPDSVAVGGAFKAFGEDGQLTDERMLERLQAAMGA